MVEPLVILIGMFTASYLIGGISFARIISRLISPGLDVAQVQIPIDQSSETYSAVSIGANSASSVLGAKWGMIIALLDILKVFVPTLLVRLFFPDPLFFGGVALTGMAGHIWPVYYRFHGGSGYSAAVGGLLAIDWLAVLVTPLAGIILGMVILRNVTVAILSWMWLLIPWFWFRTHNIWFVFFAVGINILFFLAMIPEFKVMLKFKKEGRLMEYGRGNLKSNPMGRGFLKIAKIFKINV